MNTTPLRRRRPHRSPRQERPAHPSTRPTRRSTRPTAPPRCWQRPASRTSRRRRPPATPTRSTPSAASLTRSSAAWDCTTSIRLVAHEYIVPIDASKQTTPPQLFGMDFHQHPTLPLWVLHAWLWKNNPASVFRDWSPAVRQCPPGTPIFGKDCRGDERGPEQAQALATRRTIGRYGEATYRRREPTPAAAAEAVA
jgi:hypothetical protein